MFITKNHNNTRSVMFKVSEAIKKTPDGCETFSNDNLKMIAYIEREIEISNADKKTLK